MLAEEEEMIQQDSEATSLHSSRLAKRYDSMERQMEMCSMAWDEYSAVGRVGG